MQEGLVTDPVRLESLGAAGLAHPVLVLAEAALELVHLRIADEGEHMGCDPVEKPAIV